MSAIRIGFVNSSEGPGDPNRSMKRFEGISHEMYTVGNLTVNHSARISKHKFCPSSNCNISILADGEHGVFTVSFYVREKFLHWRRVLS